MITVDDLAWEIKIQEFYMPKIGQGNSRIFVSFNFGLFAFLARSNNWGESFVIRPASNCCLKELTFPNHSVNRRKAPEELKKVKIYCPGCKQITPYSKYDLEGNVLAHLPALVFDTLETIEAEVVITEHILQMLAVLKEFVQGMEASDLYALKYLETVACVASGKLNEVSWELIERDFIEPLRTIVRVLPT